MRTQIRPARNRTIHMAMAAFPVISPKKENSRVPVRKYLTAGMAINQADTTATILPMICKGSFLNLLNFFIDERLHESILTQGRGGVNG